MAASPLRLLAANRPYRRFWLGYTLSIMGDACTKVAFTWLVYERSGSMAEVSLLMVFYMGPLVLGGLLAGWALDRFDRRIVMIADCLIRAAAIATVPVLHFAGALDVWHVYVAAAVYGFFMMVALAGAPAIIPTLVSKDELVAANALETMSFSLGGVAGPALAGVAIAWFGASVTVLIDVATYLVFAAVLQSLGLQSPRPAHRPPSSGYRATFGLLFGTPLLLSTTLMFSVFNVGRGAMDVWLPELVNTLLSGGPRLFGLLVSSIAAGSMIGALAVASLAGRRLGPAICLVQAAAGGAVLLVALSLSQWATVLGLVLFGACSAPMTAWAQTLRMQIVPPDMRGRAFAMLRLLMQAGNPIGAALAGALHAGTGLLSLMLASAGAMGIPGLLGLAVADLRKAERK
jgi:MFS family permease